AALSSRQVIDAEDVASEVRQAPVAKIRQDQAWDVGAFVADFIDGQPAAVNNLHEMLTRAFEKPLIERVLAMTGGNQIRAAEILGLNRNTLRKKIRDLDIV